jgi:hypothetical protein
MPRSLIKLSPIAVLALAACDASAPGDQSAEGTDWIDAVVAEAGDAPPPAQDWNEVPLSEGTFAEQAGYRVDEIEIPVDANGGALEYKLAMEEGDAVTYTWTAEGLTDPLLFLSEFHGHTERVGDAPGTLMFYRRAVGASESGMLVAPFTGIHGWYFKNDTEEPVVVRLSVSGFYERTD